MYSVSDDYKTQVHSAVQTWRLTGTVGEAGVTDDNILKGSLSVTNKCTESDVGLGSVCIGVLKATFLHNTGIDRFSWIGEDIKLKVGLLVNGEYEDVPLTPYTVSNAKYTAAGIVVTAYDYMEKFERAYGTDNISASPYEILTLACESCGVTLGMTQEEVEALPNGTQHFMMTDASNISTYRDLISWVAVTLGGFATINRDGALIIRTWQSEAVDTYTSDTRISGAEYETYITNYAGIYLTHNTTAEYYGGESGATISIGADPFIQQSDDDTRSTYAAAIVAAIGNIKYMPCKFSIACGVHLDLGDVITISGGLIDEDVNVCVMEYTFVYNSKYTIQSYGEDPTASASSKTDKEISGLIESTSTSAWYLKTFTNVAELSCVDGRRTQIISLSVASTIDTTLIFMAEILATVELDSGVETADITVSYRLNGTFITNYHPKQIYTASGDHIIHLLYYVPVVAGATSTFMAFITATDCTVTIAAGNIQASMSGSGMAGEVSWDGTIDVYENYEPITLNKLIDSTAFTDSVSLAPLQIAKSTITETYTPISSRVVIGTLNESASVTKVVAKYEVSTEQASKYTYDADYITTDGEYYALQTAYAYSGTKGTIDTGLMASVDVDTSIYASVSGIEVE